MRQYPSKGIEDAVRALSSFPGIGEKSALRMVLFLIGNEKDLGLGIADKIKSLLESIRFCKSCGNVSDNEECSICLNPLRDRETICLVSDIRDIMAIEQTGHYRGLYHVLGGLISPMEGIGPEDLRIEELMERLGNSECKELIIALSGTMEGETTAYYISNMLRDAPLKVSSLARGISVGAELEYADEITLSRSFANRTPLNPGDQK